MDHINKLRNRAVNCIVEKDFESSQIFTSPDCKVHYPIFNEKYAHVQVWVTIRMDTPNKDK